MDSYIIKLYINFTKYLINLKCKDYYENPTIVFSSVLGGVPIIIVCPI